jgi:exo-beta-1,3-glucanase (GH17 family)
MTRTNIIIATAIAVVTISVLALLNRPEVEPRWPSRVQGFSFSPLHANHDPAKARFPDLKQIDADLRLLENRARSVRTYSMEGTLGEIAPLAAQHGLKVTLGAWIGPDLANNEMQIARLIAAANTQPNVERVIVGNEVAYRGDIPVARLIGYIERVRNAVRVPVSTAEPWGTWLKHPELEDHVDFIAAHVLPYWEGVHVDRAVDFVATSVETLERAFPGKAIVLTEVGWPSAGRTRRAAKASAANEATFLRRFLERAERERYDYFVLEAFDQPWKQAAEGAVGAYWGVWRTGKPSSVLRSPSLPIPDGSRSAPFPWSSPGSLSP